MKKIQILVLALILSSHSFASTNTYFCKEIYRSKLIKLNKSLGIAAGIAGGGSILAVSGSEPELVKAAGIGVAVLLAGAATAGVFKHKYNV